MKNELKETIDQESYGNLLSEIKTCVILCTDKNRSVVEYALAQSTDPMGVGTYTLSSSLPKELEGKLPTSECTGNLENFMRRAIAELNNTTSKENHK
jgi:YhcG PDDEXK nuclease domain